MPNEHIKSDISVYLAGGLGEAQARQIEEHAAGCEKCRQALTKARTKQARVKREALKKASSDPLPNLFLARQGKAAGVDRPAPRTRWVLAAALFAGGICYGLYRHHSAELRSAEIAEPGVETLAVSSAPVVSSATAPAPVQAPLPAPPPPPPPAKPMIQILRQWKASDSGIKIMRLAVIRNRDLWEKLWLEMQEKEPPPPVNFDQHLVVAIFAGENPPGAAVALGTIRETDKTVVIPYHVAGFDVKVSSLSVPSHPYLLGVMSRVDKKIRITQREASE